MTQWIAETLVKYSEAYEKLEEAMDAVTVAQLKVQKVLYLNTEPIKLSDQNDKYSGITIKTPDDVRDMVAGFDHRDRRCRVQAPRPGRVLSNLQRQPGCAGYQRVVEVYCGDVRLPDVPSI